MPELPEVETMVRGIRPHVAGRVLRAVRKCRCRCRPLLMEPSVPTMKRRSVGCEVTRVYRIAKRVILELDSGDSFVIEPRMTGLMLLSDPPSRGHLRLEWQFEDAESDFASLWFWDRRGLGTIRLLTPDEMTVLTTEKLGPDALAMTEELWLERILRTSRAVKVALLDQKLVAGIGNLYASEILHLARISPLTPAEDLTRAQIRRLAKATKDVLSTAIRYEGSTLNDGTYRNALNKEGGYQNEHRVYSRAGEPCGQCRSGVIQRIVQAQRSTFYCAACQQGRRAQL